MHESVPNNQRSPEEWYEELDKFEQFFRLQAAELSNALAKVKEAKESMGKHKYPKKLSQRHMAVLKWFIDHPSGKHYECAKALGYSPTWISRIVHSPAFQAYSRRVHEKMFCDMAMAKELHFLANVMKRKP